jgi:competence protein ComEA
MNQLRSLFLLLAGCAALIGAPRAAADPVNINTADAATLARELVGVGETRAAAIVAHRTQNGPFRSVEELTLVKGIGPRVIEQNRGNLVVGPARPAARAPAPGAARGTPATAPAAKPPAARPAASNR